MLFEEGLIEFYYDYIREDSSGHISVVRGLTSRLYPDVGIDEMILHAYNGIKYFWDRRNNLNINFGIAENFGEEWYLKNDPIQLTDWAILNTAFDISFDQRKISPGLDKVRYVMEKWDNKEDEYKSQDKLIADLLRCEGYWGYIHAKYTGNPQEGYSLKCAYYCDYFEPELQDMHGAYKSIAKNREGDKLKRLQKAVAFFNKNVTPITTRDEFWGMDDMIANDFRNLMHFMVRYFF